MSITIKDLAEMTGFSTSTVSRVVSGRGYVDEKTKAVVQQAAKEVGYVYKPLNTRRGGTKMIILIMGEAGNSVYSNNIYGITQVLDARDEMCVGTFCERFNAEKLEACMRQAIRSRFRGMILLTPIETPSFIRMMERCSIPCVAMNRPVDQVAVNQVCMDNKAAGRLAVRYLAGKGHRRIAFIWAGDGGSSMEYRRKGYLDGMAQAGLEEDVLRVEHTYEGGIAAGEALAGQPEITAVYCPNETLALGVLEGLRRQGKRVPEDVSIVATDNTHLSYRCKPGLTTVSCDHREMGIQAAKLLLEEIKKPNMEKKRVFLTPEIVERESVRRVQR